MSYIGRFIASTAGWAVVLCLLGASTIGMPWRLYALLPAFQPEWRGLPATATWHGVVVPAATPAPLVERLNRDIVGALAQPDLRERLAALGAEVHAGTAREFADYIASEIPKWSKVVRDSGARIE